MHSVVMFTIMKLQLECRWERQQVASKIQGKDDMLLYGKSGS